MDYLRIALDQKLLVDETVILCKKRLMRAIVSLHWVVFSQIKEYDNLLDELLSEHEDYEWVQSLPGAGTVISSKIISHFGDKRGHFSEYNDAQALAGTAPVTVASGKYRNFRILM